MTRTVAKRARRDRRPDRRTDGLEAAVGRLVALVERQGAAAAARPAMPPPVPPVNSAQMQLMLGRLAADLKEHADGATQRVIEAEITVAEGVRDGLKELSAGVRIAGHTAAMAARRRSGPIRVLFLVHFVEAWDALADVHAQMLADPDFAVTVGTLPRFRRDRRRFEYEPEISATLAARGVAHIRLGMEPDGALDIVKAIGPDVIFRQTPWDGDIPPAFRASELTFARLAYVPYGLYTAKIESHQYDQTFHRLLWRYYAPTAEDAALLAEISPLKGVNGFLSGYPKFDRLLRAGEGPDAWPIPGPRARRRIIFAPHQSIGTGGLGFGTFPDCYRAVVAAARDHPDVQIVFKPHPTLLDVCVASKLMSEADVAWFEEAWAALPNTASYLLDDYGGLFAASDAMITEGVSFFSEYMLFDRPLVFLDSGRHTGFNPATTFLPDGMYGARGFEAAFAAALAATEPGGDVMAAARRAVIARLRPFPGEAARRIVEDVRRSLAAPKET